MGDSETLQISNAALSFVCRFVLLLFKLVHLLLQLFNDFLTKMRSFGKLLLDLLVDFNVTLESFNLGLHFVVLKQQLLSLLGLIL